jgi:hypothetical protein
MAARTYSANEWETIRGFLNLAAEADMAAERFFREVARQRERGGTCS